MLITRFIFGALLVSQAFVFPERFATGNNRAYGQVWPINILPDYWPVWQQKSGKLLLPALAPLPDSTSFVSKVPAALGYSTFYQKYLNVKGIPVVSSNQVPDAALYQAQAIILLMLEKIPDAAIAKISQNKVRVAVMGKTEQTTDIPEHSDLNKAFPATNWNTRSRGLGATLARPATSCAEENLLCYENDRYRGEDILIHEFAHTIHEMGLRFSQKDFQDKLVKIYNNALAAGLWKNTYAATNSSEYFAEGVQSWFNLNLEASPANGVHNEINTRPELKQYDPELYALISQYFANTDKKISCHAR